jgi:hypothetical protein
MVYKQLNTPPPPPQPHTVCIIQYILYFGKRGGVGEIREKVDGQ